MPKNSGSKTTAKSPGLNPPSRCSNGICMRHLSELVGACSEKLQFTHDIEITGITVDSRKVAPGYLFVALAGEKAHGASFVERAKAQGAAAVLTDKDVVMDNILPVIRAENPRLALAQMAAAFFGRQPAHMVAITGTDGKTSTADFYRQFWYHMGKSSASIGTLGVLAGDGKTLVEGSLTTPHPELLHKILADLPVDYAAMEASSHGLDQFRLDGVKLQAAAFTNIARDHLDYHKTVENYFAAKARLFSEILPHGATAVLDQDDAKFPELKKICTARGHKIIGFGKNGEQFCVVKITPMLHGQKVECEILGKQYTLEVPLVGGFQVMNILAALGLVIGTGGDLEKALAVIPKFKGVPGRLEQVAQLKNGATVFIDYAHTPAALANILNTLHPHTQHKLHVVFGCGGDRDPGKRPEMGKIADELADVAVVTDDNPRSENPALIRKAVMAVAPHAKEVADRREAIYVALKGLEAGDILVIAGKGHEKTQTIGDKILPFDDAEVTRAAVKELKL